MDRTIDAPFQYDIEICIPGNTSQSPWKNQLSRQDFSEELYFQMNFSGDGGMLNYVPRSGTYSRKLTSTPQGATSSYPTTRMAKSLGH
jgi:hypothetical protein